MKYLEKICDYTLNIGEQVIYLATGRRLKFSQYQQLGHLLPAETYKDYHFQPYYDGISGAVVARIENGTDRVIYKEGCRKKIDSEAAKLQQWQQIMPGMTPRVINTYVMGDRETLIREYVTGKFLPELYFSEQDISIKEEATRQLFKVMLNIWTLTLRDEPPPLNYINEILHRLDEVYAMHPYLEFVSSQENLEQLLVKAKEYERLLSPSFSVWLHGDFNVNNIIYDNGQIKFIDVHRSHYGDYLSDIGVFLLSIIRPPDLSDRVRKDMEKVREIVIESITDFKNSTLDETQALRLDISLARNYITSSRVIIDRRHAYWLFMQGIGILKARFG
jgi:aminoglycoside phosphotransferase